MQVIIYSIVSEGFMLKYSCNIFYLSMHVNLNEILWNDYQSFTNFNNYYNVLCGLITVAI